VLQARAVAQLRSSFICRALHNSRIVREHTLNTHMPSTCHRCQQHSVAVHAGPLNPPPANAAAVRYCPLLQANRHKCSGGDCTLLKCPGRVSLKRMHPMSPCQAVYKATATMACCSRGNSANNAPRICRCLDVSDAPIAMTSQARAGTSNTRDYQQPHTKAASPSKAQVAASTALHNLRTCQTRMPSLVSRTLRECGHQYMVHAVTHACRVHELHVLSGVPIGCATQGPSTPHAIVDAAIYL
jgi:hypothetical protein